MPRSRRQTKPVPKEAVVDKEMSDLGQVRKVRFGLATKFTAPVAAALSLIIVLMGFVVYGSTSDSLEFQLSQQGVFAVRIAAAPEIDSWDKDYNTYEERDRRKAVDDAELALAGGQAEPMGSSTEPAAATRLQEKRRKEDERQKSHNLARLKNIIATSKGPGIYLDMWILNSEGKVKAKAGSAKRWDPARFYELPTSPETKISTGTYTGNNGSEPARVFEHPIKDKNGDEIGTAVVVFSERGIRADLNDLRGSIILFCILGVVVCAGVAFGTSKMITRPLGLLIKDIKVIADGDLAHRTRARSKDELGSLAVAIDHMTQNLAAAEVMRVDLADKEHQVSIAQEVQERLFPQELSEVPGLSLEAGNRLSGDLSADLFDAVTREDGRVALLVMTSSGRGLPAAIVLSMARALFRARGVQKDNPAEALKGINEMLAPDLRRGMYVTALYAIIDPDSGEGTMASAGHRVPALHFLAERGGIRKLQADGIAMGLDRGPVFDRSLTEIRFTLEAGDRLLLATEGAFLRQNAEGDPIGEEAFMRIVLAACKKGDDIDSMLQTLESKFGAQPGDHDLTLVMAARR